MSTLRCFLKAKSAACLLLLAVSSSTFAQSAQPVAPVREVTDNYFGQKIVDPYRWMEDSKNPETVAWMKAQADYTRAYLDRLPMRQELLERITKLSNAGDRRGVARDLADRLRRQLDVLNRARSTRELNLPGYRLHQLKGAA